MMGAMNCENTLNLLSTIQSKDYFFRMIPLPSASLRIGPILLYSTNSNISTSIHTIIGLIGTVIPLISETQIFPLLSIAGHISSFYTL